MPGKLTLCCLIVYASNLLTVFAEISLASEVILSVPIWYGTLLPLPSAFRFPLALLNLLLFPGIDDLVMHLLLYHLVHLYLRDRM